MAIGNLQSASSGISRGFDAMREQAQVIATARVDGQEQENTQANGETAVKPTANESSQGSIPPTSETGRTSEALVKLEQASLQTQAAAKAQKVESDTLGTMVDTHV